VTVPPRPPPVAAATSVARGSSTPAAVVISAAAGEIYVKHRVAAAASRGAPPSPTPVAHPYQGWDLEIIHTAHRTASLVSATVGE